MITHFVARTALILSCKPLADKRVIKGKMIRSSQVGNHILLGIESSNSHHVAIKYLYPFFIRLCYCLSPGIAMFKKPNPAQGRVW